MPRLSKREAPSVYAVLLTATTSSVLSLAWLCTLALGLEALTGLAAEVLSPLRITQIHYFD